ncbi:hypothetical protein [Kineococcus sp. SYSU DK018]|uniref:hypothetical protein n=1 Tax=Kineococcus sp. SYSU DK018 TaxID=3383139 RepID=UPI003D7C3E12
MIGCPCFASIAGKQDAGPPVVSGMELSCRWSRTVSDVVDGVDRLALVHSSLLGQAAAQSSCCP